MQLTCAFIGLFQQNAGDVHTRNLWHPYTQMLAFGVHIAEWPIICMRR